MASTTAEVSLAARVDAQNWKQLRSQLDTRGFAVTTSVLGKGECQDLEGLFDGGRFRSTIDMARHRFGDGRLERPAPGPLRGSVLPLPGGHGPIGARGGLRGRRVRAARAAPAGTEPSSRAQSTPWSLRHLPLPAPPSGGQARTPQGRVAPRPEHAHERVADSPRLDLPRREVAARAIRKATW